MAWQQLSAAWPRPLALLSATVAVSTLLALAPGPSGAAVPKVLCGTPDGRTVVGGAKGRIYTVPRDGLTLDGTPATHTFACLRGGKPKRLQSPPNIRKARSGEAIDNMVLRAPWVAFSWEVIQIDVQYAGVSVINARTGRVLRSANALATADSPFITVPKVVLKGNGSVAWAAEGSNGVGGLVGSEVGASDKSGTKVLDSQLGIDPRSLQLIGSELRWNVDGVPRGTVLE